MTQKLAHWLMFAILLICQFPICLATENPDANDSSKYLKAVREFADNVLKYGRDTYGPKHTPLFVDGLNIHTHEPVKWIAPNGDRLILSNLASQQNLFRTLDGLTRITGDPKYKQAAMEAIEYAFENLRSPNGLLYWGGHSAYDAQADRTCGRGIHELKGFYPYYELMWEVDPNATKKFIEAFWSAHVMDWSNLDMNRHGPMGKPLPTPWKYEYKGGPVFFKSTQGTSISASRDLIYAAAWLTKLSAAKEPLIWGKRLAHRYVETRHPKTGISYWCFSTSLGGVSGKGSCDDIIRKLVPGTGDFPWYELTNRIGRECCLGYFMPTPGISVQRQVFLWQSHLLVGEMLGSKGKEFEQWALEELTAYGKASYRRKDNAYVPILTDGTNLEGYVVKEDGTLGPKGVALESVPAGPSDFWAYTMGYRVTKNGFMWEMVHSIAKGNEFGDIGATPKDRPQLKIGTGCSDPYALMAFLELHKGTGNNGFLEMAKRLGDNILARRFHKGFFVASNKHIYTKFDAVDSLALLHLHSALLGGISPIPEVWPSTPFFEDRYRKKDIIIDNQIIYTLTESAEPPMSLQEAAAVGDIDQVKSLIEKGTWVDIREDSFFKTALHRAAISGHKDVVELLLAKGAQIDAWNGFPGGTPLDYAAENGHKEIVELLIAKGADINTIRRGYPTGDTPLHSAARAGHKDIVELLIANGASVNVKNNDGQTPIDVALQRRRWTAVKDLIDAGADISQVNADGQTPLHIAARRNQKDLVEILLDKGLDIDAGDNRGQTPLHMAAEGGHKEIIELLLARGARINAKDQQGATPALIALYKWSPRVTDLLLEKGADATSPHLAAYTGDLSRIKNLLDTNSAGDDHRGLTLLHTAAAGGHVELVNYLIGKGFDVKASTEDGLTSLHYAAMGNHQEIAEIIIAEGTPVDAGETTPLSVAARAGHKDMVQYLISKGADINRGPQTALHTAVDWWEMDAVKLLLDLGAEVNAQNDVGNTPLHAAVDTWWLKVAEVLISHGAKIDLKNTQGQTPLLMAADYWFNGMVRLLIQKGADIHAKDDQGRTALDIALQQDNRELAQLLEAKGAKSLDGQNILHRAAANDTAEEFKSLLAQKLDIALRDARDGSGFTPLHCAILSRRTGNAWLLIDKGADLNVQDEDGYTPLHHAVWQGMKDMVEFLIGRGANLNTQDNRGWTPLHRAVIGKQKDIARLLIEKGADTAVKDKEGRTPLWWAEDLGLDGLVEQMKKGGTATSPSAAEADQQKRTRSPNSQYDIAVTDVSIPSDCNQGDTVSVTVSVANQGVRRETSRVILTDQTSGEEIADKEVTLAKGWKDGPEDVADLILSPTSSGKHNFGWGFNVHGDVNRDGCDDLLVGASLWNETHGRAYLYFGGADMDGIPDLIFAGEAAGDFLGDGGAALGDVNGDGYDDVIIGARGYNNNDGRLYIFFGGIDMDKEGDVILDGEPGKTGYFSCNCLSVGDVDKDGHADVLVGASGYDRGRGRVYLYYRGDPMDSSVDVVFEGEHADDLFGRNATIGQDIDGDGYRDILIGARTAPEGTRNGRAYLFYGGDRNQMDAVCDMTLTPPIYRRHEFGSSLDIYDIDSDGHADVVIGARLSQGAVFVYWGDKRDKMDAVADVIILGEDGAQSSLGGDKLFCADFNIDGYGDIAVGAYNWLHQSRIGRTYIYYGGIKTSIDAQPDVIFTGETEGSWFGHDIGGGDFNNDGYTDLVAGAWGYNNKEGRAYMFYAPFEDKTNITFNWNTTNASPGKHILRATMAPVAGEENTTDKTKTITVNVKGPSQ